jgi:CheY-like chemotaxis protein
MFNGIKKISNAIFSKHEPTEIALENTEIMLKEKISLLIIDDDKDFAYSLKEQIGSPLEPIFTDSKSLSEVLKSIVGIANYPIDAIYISAELKLRENTLRTSASGLEILKHIRLTDHLGEKSLLPVIVGLWLEPHTYVQANIDNIVLFSPGCFCFRLPQSLSGIMVAYKRCKKLSSIDDLKISLRPFFQLTPWDYSQSQHDLRNKHGALKLLNEIVGEGLEQDSLVDYNNFKESSLWLKKTRFLEKNELESVDTISKKSVTLDQFRLAMTNKRILYIDDEHRLGWSYALYRLLKGEIDSTVLMKTEHIISNDKSDFICIDSFELAKQLFEQQNDEFNSLLDIWSKSESKLADTERLYRDNLLTVGNIKNKMESAKKEFENSKVKLCNAENIYFSACQKFKTDGPDFEFDVAAHFEKKEIEIEDQRFQKAIRGLSELLSQYNTARNARMTASEEVDSARAKYESILTEYTGMRSKLDIINNELKNIDRNFDDISSKVDQFFKFDLIILDLKLQKDNSKNSGIELLNFIKCLNPAIPVVIFTGVDTALTNEKTRDLGADGYWVKAVSSVVDLMQIIVECLRNKENLSDYWIKSLKVRLKNTLYGLTYSKNATVPDERKINRNSVDRKYIDNWLIENYWFLSRQANEFETNVLSLDPSNKIIMNLGLIQETCFKYLNNERWKPFENTPEHKLHELRNKVAHPWDNQKGLVQSEKIAINEVYENIETTFARLFRRESSTLIEQLTKNMRTSGR